MIQRVDIKNGWTSVINGCHSCQKRRQTGLNLNFSRDSCSTNDNYMLVLYISCRVADGQTHCTGIDTRRASKEKNTSIALFRYQVMIQVREHGDDGFIGSSITQGGPSVYLQTATKILHTGAECRRLKEAKNGKL